jgi:hypothetical protein
VNRFVFYAFKFLSALLQLYAWQFLARSQEKLDDAGEKRYPARRWVVERTLSWLSKCRAILVRYEKKAANYLGLIKVACILLWYRRQHRLSLLR